MDAETQLIKIFGEIAGIGGLALGVFLLLFKNLLKKIVAPNMTKEHWFRVVVIFMLCVWSIGLAGIGAWVWVTIATSKQGSLNLHSIEGAGKTDDILDTKPFPTNVVGVLVLRIIGDSDGSFQAELVSSLNAEIAKDPTEGYIQVLACGDAVDEKRGLSAAHVHAREIGAKMNARLVVWGNKIGDSRFFPRVTIVHTQIGRGEHTLGVQDIHEVSLPKETVNSPLYLAHFLTGCSFYFQRQFELALKHFETARDLDQASPEERATLQLFTGNTHYALAREGFFNYLALAVEEFSSAADYFQTADPPAEYFEKYAVAEASLGCLYWNRGTSESINQSISAFQSALRVCDETNNPLMWAFIEDNLGVAYYDLPTGDTVENFNNAIDAFNKALRVYTKDDNTAQWGLTLTDLSCAYADLPTGDRVRNIEQAISSCQLALTVLTETNFSREWASAEHALGLIYSRMPGGDREKYLSKAIDCFQAALRVRTEKDYAFDWAQTQLSLGNALGSLSTGNRVEDLNGVIGAETLALRVFTKKDFPFKWAMTQSTLGNAYAALTAEGHAENFSLAIVAFNNAFTVLTAERYPRQWAANQLNLSAAYISSSTRDRTDNCRLAIESCESALTVFTERDFSAEWAATEQNLGLAYGIIGKLQKSTDCFTAALRVIDERSSPSDWASIQFHLGLVYDELSTTGDPITNLLAAKEHFSNALRIMNAENSPKAYPIAVSCLALAEADLKRLRPPK